MTKPVVEVLLSTFNAGEYLTPLLESVWSQDDVDVRVHVRDDGSTDGTRETVAQLARRGVVAVELGAIGPMPTSACWRRPRSTAPTLPSAIKMICG